MSEEQINDFLLDQELSPEDLPGENELPDDIDAILDAVEEEDIGGAPGADLEDLLYSDESARDVLNEPVDIEDEEVVTGDDLEKEINIAATVEMGEDSIPLMRDIIDPNDPPQAANSVMTLSDDMMFEIMAKIQYVVEQSVNNEIGKLATTVRDNVVQDVKEQLPGVLSQVLKGK